MRRIVQLDNAIHPPETTGNGHIAVPLSRKRPRIADSIAGRLPNPQVPGSNPGEGTAPAGSLRRRIPAGNLAGGTDFRLSATEWHTILSVLFSFGALWLHANRVFLILPAVQRTGGPAFALSQRLSSDPFPFDLTPRA